MSCNGGFGFGKRCVRGLGGLGDGGGLGNRRGLGRGGLEVLEGFEGTEEHAVRSIDTPLNASKGIETGVESVAERRIALDGGVDKFGAGEALVEDVDAEIPKLRFDAAEASLDPFGRDKGVDERELDRIGGAVVLEELFGECF